MIDYNCGYESSQLLAIQNFCESFQLLLSKLRWIEEPTLPQFSSQWSKSVCIDLAAGENHHGLESMKKLIDNNVMYIMPDFGRTLPISDFPSLLSYAQSSKSKITPHSFSSGFLAYISLYLIMALKPEDQFMSMISLQMHYLMIFYVVQSQLPMKQHLIQTLYMNSFYQVILMAGKSLLIKLFDHGC